MSLVQMGRQWVINNKKDLDNAIKILKENEFCAEMSDDFSAWRREKDEVIRQRTDVYRQAKEKGII